MYHIKYFLNMEGIWKELCGFSIHYIHLHDKQL